MKKNIFLLVVLMFSFIIAACSDDDNDKVIKFSEIPTSSQEFIAGHFGYGGIFDDSEIRRVKVESNGDFEVILKNSVEVDFYANGVWKEIDLNGQDIPQSIIMLLPAKALEYIGLKYPTAVIEEIEKQGAYSDTQGFKIELRGDRDIYFDYLGNVLKDKGEAIEESENVGHNALPEVAREFLQIYFGNISATPKVEKDWNKYEVTYYEGADNEVDIEFLLDGEFKSIELESENNMIRAIMNDISKSENIVKYIDTNYLGYFMEEFSVINTDILGTELNGGYRVDIEKGNDEWKLYFKSDGSFYKKVND